MKTFQINPNWARPANCLGIIAEQQMLNVMDHSCNPFTISLYFVSWCSGKSRNKVVNSRHIPKHPACMHCALLSHPDCMPCSRGSRNKIHTLLMYIKKIAY